MSASPPHDDDRERLREWAARAGVSYLYPITFISPGDRTPEIQAEDLAISEIESLICSILAAKTNRDITELAGMRRERLGERAGVIAAAGDFVSPAPGAPGSRACQELLEGAQMWLHRARLTMREDGFVRAAELSAAALSLDASDADGAAAMLMRAKVAAAESETCADLVAEELATLFATRAAIRATEVNTGDVEGSRFALDAALTSARASLITAARANTIVTNHRRLAQSMKHAQSLLENAPDLMAGIPTEMWPELAIEMNFLRGRCNELAYLSDGERPSALLDSAIDESREALRLAIAHEVGLPFGECSLQLWRQLSRRWPDPPQDIALEQWQTLINGLLNSEPMSRVSFEFLLVWADFLYMNGQISDTREDSALAVFVWSTCCQRLRKRNLSLCFEAAEGWGRRIEETEGQPLAAGPFCLAAEAGLELSRRPGLEGHASSWLAEMSDVRSFATASLAASGREARATEVAESGRSVLKQADLSLAGELVALRSAGHPELAEAYAEAWAAQRLVVSEMERVPQPASWDQSEIHHLKLADVARPLRAATDAIQERPGFMSFPKGPSYSKLRAAADDAPIAYIAPGLTSGTLLLLKNSSDDAPMRIMLPEFNHSAVNDHALDLRFALAREPDPFAPNGWAERLDAVGKWLWDVLVERLLDAAEGSSRIRLIPLGLSAFLPIHIAWTTSPGGRAYAIDTTAFSYLPSAALRLQAKKRAVGDGWRGLIVEGDDLAPEASEIEMRGAARRDPNHVALSGPSATSAAFVREIGRCNFAHVSAHGFLDDRYPVESGFRLSEDEVVRMKQLRSLRLSNLELLILSSCESAMVSTATPDETYGLAGLFYGTSATAVIAAQWRVDQLSTAALFDAFYAQWDGSHDPGEMAEALRRAQLAVRDGGRTNPLWWGGFTLTG